MFVEKVKQCSVLQNFLDLLIVSSSLPEIFWKYVFYSIMSIFCIHSVQLPWSVKYLYVGYCAFKLCTRIVAISTQVVQVIAHFTSHVQKFCTRICKIFNEPRRVTQVVGVLPLQEANNRDQDPQVLIGPTQIAIQCQNVQCPSSCPF